MGQRIDGVWHDTWPLTLFLSGIIPTFDLSKIFRVMIQSLLPQSEFRIDGRLLCLYVI